MPIARELDSPVVDPKMKFQSAALLAVSLIVAGGQAQAQTCACNGQECGTWQSQPGFAWRCEAGYHANNMWPAQYVPSARCAVNSAYTAMINNGWRRQNLLGNYHFEEGTNDLTTAGKLKTKWILTQAPQDRRTVFIERGSDQSETAGRIAAVHSWTATQSSIGEPAMVNDTHIVSEGHTAGSVDHVFVGFQSHQPAPVLPASTGSSSSSSQ
jgi:hypothetical protein